MCSSDLPALDVFSLAATLFHLATGQLPFPARDTPTRLDPRQEELLRELAAIRGEEKPDGKLTPGGSKTFFGRIRDAFNDH